MTTDATRRPRSVTTAVVLLILGTFIAGMAATGPQGHPTTVLPVALCFWFAVRAGRGRRIARITVTCLTVVVLVLSAPYAFDDPLYGGATLLLGAALAVPGLALLYLPAAERYVRARTEEAGT
ncbi:hypothetical protein [Streptomyces pactum]|uniref:Uncharacterized protein n=1 Tax=Streptomyces pactum TaxID=68249 RepID=A0A1S6J4V7_9ACTN|nr:hypothetical protein [Streptomyces pactum]AQS66784.1 hypothetical protein B1H29_07420 [Streptomyces pactum]